MKWYLKKAKTLCSLVLCATMSAALAACAGNASQSSVDQTVSNAPDTQTNSPGGTEPASGGDRVEITYMFWADEAEAKAVQEVIERYNASQDHTTVLTTFVPETQYVEKINTMAAGKNLPDAAIMNESIVLSFAENGLLADVSQMYSGGPQPLESLAFKYNGDIVGWSTANEVLLLYYSKDLFDQAGVDYPPNSADKAWTWPEFVEAAKKLTKDSKGNTPNDAGFNPDDIVTYGANVDTLVWMWPIFAISNGGGLVSEDGKEILIDMPESIEAAQAIANLYLVDKVAPAPASAASMPTLDVTLLTGQVAMATGGQWNIGTTLANSLDAGLNYGVAVLPKFKKAVTYNTGGPQVIFNTTQHMKETEDFLKWYTNEENNWELIEKGIWMPVLESYYTEEALMKKWVENPNFPPLDEYKPAVIDYAMNNAVPVPWYYVASYSKLEDVLRSGMDSVWLGSKTAEDALKAMGPRLRQILKENN